MFVDTHGHASFAAFKHDSHEVLKRALENNTWVIMPGTQYETSKKAVDLAEKCGKGVYAAIGLHPVHVSERREVDVLEVQSENVKEERWMTFETKSEEFDYAKYKELGQSKKVVAVGECGLDYYYEPKSRERKEAQRLKQKSTLAQQVKLAQELNLPIIFHCRKAHNDLIEFLTTYNLQPTLPVRSGQTSYKLKGVVHCYTGDLKQAEKFYNLGLYFGFNGLIFKDVPALPSPKEIIGALPLERIVLETDSPYLLAPLSSETLAKAEQAVVGTVPTTRNEPVFVRYVAEEIARIKGISIDEVASQTTANAKFLFALPGSHP